MIGFVRVYIHLSLLIVILVAAPTLAYGTIGSYLNGYFQSNPYGDPLRQTNNIGTGVGPDGLIITVTDDFSVNDSFPTQLEDSFAGCPVTVEIGGPLYTLQGRGGPGGGGRVLEGNQGIQCKEHGTVFAILQGVNNPSDKYLVSSSHVIQGTNCGGIGKFAIDARPCNRQPAYLDAASVLLNKNVQSSPNIRNFGAPKGFKKPTIGMKLEQGGSTSGHVSSEVTQINFSQNSNTNQQGNCPVKLMDMFVASKCGRPGDSGSAIISEDGYLVGICTFGSNPAGGTSGNCKAYNPSMWWRTPSILKCTTQNDTGGVTSNQPTQRKSKGWGLDYSSYNYNYSHQARE